MNTTRFAGLAVLAVSLFLGGCGASMTSATMNDGVTAPAVRTAPMQRAIGTAAFHPLAQPSAKGL